MQVGQQFNKWTFSTQGIKFCNKASLQFGTQVKFRWSRDRDDRTAENAFSRPGIFLRWNNLQHVDFSQGFVWNNILGLVVLAVNDGFLH